MEIRAGASINVQECAGFRKMPKESLPATEWLTFDQVITGTNEARRKINRYFRRQKEYRSWWPCANDKLICLRNENDGGMYYINGVQAMALNDATYISDFDTVVGDIVYEGSVVAGVPFYRFPFQAHYDAQAVEDPLQSRRGMVQDFDYAYAITVHKSQGSEWDRVLLADDGMQSNNKEFRKRWLYTAVTRAKRELVWLF
jgi:exodeoxyribonuclease-5